MLTKVLPGEVVYGDSADEEEENDGTKEEVADRKAFNGLTTGTGPSSDAAGESSNYSPTSPGNEGEKMGGAVMETISVFSGASMAFPLFDAL